MKPLLGRCKECDYVLFATPEDVRPAESFADVKISGMAYRTQSGVFARCNQRHRVFLLKPIKGTYSEEHKCDSRCLTAKGWKCTCSCGGANHGRGHAVTAHKAADASSVALLKAPPKPPKRFLGEPDKFIKGTARVSRATDCAGSRPTRLYTLLSQDESAVIKWFAPANTPEFRQHGELEVGETVTFRAKVERHEDHPTYGKATIVTDLKEIEKPQ